MSRMLPAVPGHLGSEKLRTQSGCMIPFRVKLLRSLPSPYITTGLRIRNLINNTYESIVTNLSAHVS